MMIASRLLASAALAAALAAGSVLLQSLLIAPAAWFAIRAGFGFCAANIFMALESWLNDRATNQTRGRILSSYVIVTLTFLTLGQWLLQRAWDEARASGGRLAPACARQGRAARGCRSARRSSSV